MLFRSSEINADSILRDLDLSNTALVLNVHIDVVARMAAGETLTLMAEPAKPRSGQSYRLTLRHSGGAAVTAAISVVGTDGFRLRQEGSTSSGSFELVVPGGDRGVQDSIAAEGEFGVLRLTLVFSGDLSNGEGGMQTRCNREHR